MGKRQFELSEAEIKEIKRYESQSKRLDERKRLQAIRLYGSGYPLEQVLEIVGCGESSVRIWAMQYKREGIAGILSHYANSAQNARKLTLEQAQALRAKLKEYTPNQVLAADAWDGTGQFWTVATVKRVVQLWYGVSYRDDSSYRTLLHRCGFSYQKTEQVYKSRPSPLDVADFEATLEKK